MQAALDLFWPNAFPPIRDAVSRSSNPDPARPIHGCAPRYNGLQLPIGDASSVVRRYPTTLTDEPERHAQIMRGAVVGGSGAVNGGYFCRGLPTDFDGWGLPGWAWAEVLPHFRAIETDLDFDTPLHGSDGPIIVRRVSEFDGCTASFVRAAGEAGYRWVDDLNGATLEEPLPTGVGAVPLNINGGTRVGPGGAYLQPAMDRTNLTLLTNTRVGRVRIVRRPGGRRGLRWARRCHRSDRRSNHTVRRCNRIGAPADAVRCRPAGCAAGRGRAGGGGPAGRYGVCGPPGVGAAGGLVRDPRPAAAGGGAHHVDGLEIRPYTAGFGAMVSGRRDDPADHPHIGVALMQPKSRGRVRLVSADPDAHPVIEHRYDSEPADVARLSAGAELARELAGARAKSATVSWSTSQHLSGTAPMGGDDDAVAVVDPQCRVRGVDGLWVVDGSVLPAITSRGPHATIVMIGHRAAEFIDVRMTSVTSAAARSGTAGRCGLATRLRRKTLRQR